MSKNKYIAIIAIVVAAIAGLFVLENVQFANKANHDTQTQETPKTSEENTSSKEPTIEAKPLNAEDFEKNLDVTFTGNNGTGSINITNKFVAPLDKLEFVIANNGKLSNGENVEITLTEADKRLLEDNHFQQMGKAIYVVSGLTEAQAKQPVAQSNFTPYVPADILAVKNYADLQDIISQRRYKDYVEYEAGDQYTFDVYYEYTVYRQYSIDDPGVEPQHRNGLLINVYTIHQYEGKNKDKYLGQYYSLLGVGNIYVNENGCADLSRVSQFKEVVTDGRSDYQMYEALKGNGLYKINN